MAKDDDSFRPALLVVDVQEDFCPPRGSLAVTEGRDIATAINQLLSLPFVLKVATRDFHPEDHISFATSHSPPDNKPFESSVMTRNPYEPSQEHTIRLWPPHCVQGTPGAEIIPELDVSKVDMVVDKGQDKRLEMYSAFADVFAGKSPGATNVDLAGLLRQHSITHVFTVGLAGDFCVKCTAIDAKKEGFEVCVVEEAVKSIDTGASGWGTAKQDMEKIGIRMVSMNGSEVARLKSGA